MSSPHHPQISASDSVDVPADPALLRFYPYFPREQFGPKKWAVSTVHSELAQVISCDSN